MRNYMRVLDLFVCLVVISESPWMVLSRQELCSRECENLGFTGLALCSDCKTFAEYVKDQEEATIPSFAFSWSDDKDTFLAGDIATIRIKVLGDFNSKGNASLEKSAFSPSITVNGKQGNSSYISGVLLDTSGDTSAWKIDFVPIMAGLFNLIINDDPFKVMDSSLHFTVEPGPMYPACSVVSWMGSVNECEAGSKAQVLILPKDAFGNVISSKGKSPDFYSFSVIAFYDNGSIASSPNVTYKGWDDQNYIKVEFIAVVAGKLQLHIESGNETLNGSPLPLKVKPGPIDVSNCVAKWKFEMDTWQIFSKMEVFIHQQDHYGNIAPGMYAFDADVIEKATNLSIPVPDMQFQEVQPGIQLLSFTMSELGNFLLIISDMKHNITISNMPYAYSVFVGYCNGSNSVVNGTGLNSSVAGEATEFSVYLTDSFQYPSLLEVEKLQVQVKREVDSYSVPPFIYPREIINTSRSMEGLHGSAPSNTEMALAPAPSFSSPNSTSGGGSKVQATSFNVVFTPEKSGTYNIIVFCGNILLNGGYPFKKAVKAGSVNISLSSVERFDIRAPKLLRNDIRVQLKDRLSNPVLLQQSRLKLKVVSGNMSGFSTYMFLDNNDGSYTGSYLAKEVGTYEICTYFDDQDISPCPFVINVYGSDYFPKACNDTISVWEDESIAFNVVENDYFAGANASIFNFTKPAHGSVVQYGNLLRYTPYKDYFGNDSFLYTISDINKNLATSTVDILVLTIPPQFVHFPSQLLATEDTLSPRFGGYSGFQLKYSDPNENISVSLGAQSGGVFLSPPVMQFWQPMWTELSVYDVHPEGKNLTMEGCLEVINFALQSIQYLGNGNFSGEDKLTLVTRNKNGMNVLVVPVVVEPMNDPPNIQIPRFIILKKSHTDESRIFNKEQDKFEFSVGDPDHLYFPGGESRFLVAFSVEVDNGYLRATLPSALITSTEVKLMYTYQWQPLQTYVAISKHFVVKASGIRFRGTLSDCSSVMQELYYHGEEHSDILTVKLSDMGHYGCYSDCAEKRSVPLFVEVSSIIVRRKPMTSLEAHALGTAIVVEFFLVLLLGLVLLFFTCKCAINLVNERRGLKDGNIELPNVQQSEGSGLAEPAANCTGRLFLRNKQSSS